MRQTHTYANLAVSYTAFDEIKTKLEAAGYGDQFIPDDEGLRISMQGIAIVSEPPVLQSVLHNPITEKPDGTKRHGSVAGVLKFFKYAHLPPHLRAVSEACAVVAFNMADTHPENPELTVGLRKLLEAKDCFVRAALPADE